MAVWLEDEPCSLLPGAGLELSEAGRQETGWDWGWDWEWGWDWDWDWDWHWDARAMLQEARWLLPAPCPLQKALVARRRPDELCCAPGAQTLPCCRLLLWQAVCGPWDLGFKHLAR